MNEAIYTFQGKDITMNVCIQIRAVVNILQEKLSISFEEAMMLFYHSKTYKTCSKRKTLFGRKRQNILPTDILKNTRMERGNLTIGKTFAGGFY